MPGGKFESDTEELDIQNLFAEVFGMNEELYAQVSHHVENMMAYRSYKNESHEDSRNRQSQRRSGPDLSRLSLSNILLHQKEKKRLKNKKRNERRLRAIALQREEARLAKKLRRLASYH